MSTDNRSFESAEFGLLDALNLISFYLQMDNIEQDEIQAKYLKLVIQAIANEVEKIHRENNIIIKQNNEILKLLRK
jgi:predicted nucleic acid-binding protein